MGKILELGFGDIDECFVENEFNSFMCGFEEMKFDVFEWRVVIIF